MKNNKKTITPNEINKYLYCPYQFYYERYHGRKELTSLYKERNKRLGLENKTLSNFKKGTEHHESYYQQDAYRSFIRIVLVAAIVVLILFYLFN